MLLSLTYGVLPPKEAYIRAFEATCLEGHFSFENDKRVNSQSLCCSALWREIVDAHTEGTEDSLDWISLVFFCLGIEWV